MIANNKMPPAAGFGVIAEHIRSLMIEIGSVKTEITSLKSVSSASTGSIPNKDIQAPPLEMSICT